MDFLSFKIKNFKGIKEVKIDFDKEPSGRIFTLVGLNESGKTTLLEALNVFQQSSSESLSPIYGQSHDEQDASNYIPKHRAANFSDSISVTARLSVDETSKKLLASHIRKQHGFRIDSVSDVVEIEKRYLFKDSELEQSQNLWTISLKGRTRQGTKTYQVQAKGPRAQIWRDSVTYIGANLVPPVLYFPSFAVDLPDRIYLSGPVRETDIFYQRIVQDILDSLDEDLEIQKHIVDRLESVDGDEKKKGYAKQVVRKMSRQASKEIIKGWNEIFSSSGMKGKKIQIEAEREMDSDGAPVGVYVTFHVEQGEELYKISERSLGFRWFFCFILFTRFRGERKSANKALFLFDEPASNLHSAAQSKLLESFQKIVETGCSIAYSTHSQYMINPQWLENAFVVVNQAIDYDPDEVAELDTDPPLVEATRYREFANQHPSKSTYFQPILDLLEYRPSDIEQVPRAVLVEGKSDFYLYEYMRSVVLQYGMSGRFIPCFSASAMDELVGLYMGWRREYVVVLDDDDEGRTQRDRYVYELGIPEEHVWTLADFDESFDGYELEDLLSTEDQRTIVSRGNPPDGNPVKKKAIGRAVQELLAQKICVEISDESKDRFRLLFSGIDETW